MTKQEMWAAIREHYKLKRNHDVAEFFGISDQAANGWTKGGIFHFEEVYRRCPEISPDWLLSQGENGPMIKPLSQTINGDHNTQVGGDFRQECTDAINKAFSLMEAEQENNRKMQEQNSALIDIIANLTKSK